MAKIPEFKSVKEAAEFWDTHDTTEYFDDMEDAELSVKGEQSLSPRCEHCGDILLSRYIDLDILDGALALHNARQLYCRRCGHTIRLAPETEALVEALSAAFQRVKQETAAA